MLCMLWIAEEDTLAALAELMQQLPSWQQAAITAGVNKLHALAEVWSVAAVGGPCTHTAAWLVRILLQQHQVIQPQLLRCCLAPVRRPARGCMHAKLQNCTHSQPVTYCCRHCHACMHAGGLVEPVGQQTGGPQEGGPGPISS
jgi:hypothetical protein